MNSAHSPTAALAALTVLTLACGGNAGPPAIRASGHVEATEVRLAATVGGRLLEAPFEEGERVRAGEVVARLDTALMDHELARARAEAEAADARLRLLVSGSRAEDIRRAEEQLAQAQAELDAARRELGRLATLAERGTATEKARDDAVTRREVAERGVAARRAELDKLLAGSRREEIEAARAQRAAAEAAVAAVNQRIAEATVLAPRDGVITVRAAEPGEVLAPGAPLAVLTDLAHAWLNVWVDEPSLAHIRLGQEVEVSSGQPPVTRRGRVAFVSPVAEFTPKNVQTPEERAKLVFRIKVALPNPDGVFKPGMPADATFTPVARP
ncbi:MAG: HlyD family efflux transporter periplasmic adaptor subunit [Acidobacteriota bacterium]|jgi:HlyD family secretion protein